MNQNPLIAAEKDIPLLHTDPWQCNGCTACYAICPLSGDGWRNSENDKGETEHIQIDFMVCGLKKSYEHTGALRKRI